MNKNIKRLLIGRFISSMSAGIFSIALPLYFYKTTNSLLNLGALFMLIKIPSIIVTPKIGLIVEKINKKNMLVACDYLSGCLFILLISLNFIGYNNMILFCIVTSLYLILENAFSISSSVLFTQLTNNDNRLKINGIKSGMDNITGLAAPGVGALLFSLIGMKGIYFINIVAYLVSATMELFIEYQYEECQKIEHYSIKDYKEVIIWLKHHFNILGLLGIVMVLNFFVAPNEEVLLVGILIGKYGVSSFYYGLSTSVFIMGSLLASVLITKTKITKRISLNKLFILNSFLLVLIGLTSIIFFKKFIWQSFYIIYVIFTFLVGTTTTFINVPLITRFQTEVPVKKQGRFFAMLTLSSSFLIPVGIFSAGIISSLIGADITLIIYNIIVILFVWVIFKLKKKKKKKETYINIKSDKMVG